MLKRFTVLSTLFLLTGCFAFSPEVKDPAPENELNKVVDNFEKINNPGKIQCRSYFVKIIASVPAMQVQIQMETYADLEKNRIRTTVTISGALKQVELYDGKNGYSIIPGLQTKVLTGDKVAFLRYSARHVTPWSVLRTAYENMKMDKKTVMVNGKSCYRLVCQPIGEPSLMPVEIFIDSKTFYPVRTRNITVSDLGKVPNTIDYLKFRKYEGALIGQTFLVQQLNIQMQTELQEVKINCPIPDSIFNAEMIEDEED